MEVLKRYKLNNGEIITSRLDIKELGKRLDRLNWLMTLTEAYEEGTGKDIYKKVSKAYYKTDNFTGIVKFNINELDFLSWFLDENNKAMAHPKEIEAIKYYVR